MNLVNKIKKSIANIPQAEVIDYQEKQVTRKRPPGLNTVELLKAASSRLGIGPKDAMHIAERLYLSGYLTYPRTESSKYPSTFDFKGVINSLARLG